MCLGCIGAAMGGTSTIHSVDFQKGSEVEIKKELIKKYGWSHNCEDMECMEEARDAGLWERRYIMAEQEANCIVNLSIQW